MPDVLQDTQEKTFYRGDSLSKKIIRRKESLMDLAKQLQEMKLLHQCKQWEIYVGEGEDAPYVIVNQGPNGTLMFYAIVSGQYGQPLIVQEPSLGVPAPKGVSILDAKGQPVSSTQNLVGFICRDYDGEIVYRLSLTNAHNKGIRWHVSDGGVVILDEKPFWLHSLVAPDRNRMEGLVAFCGPQKRESVALLELEDLIP